MYKGSTVSLIVPCHNEAPRIDNVIKPALKSKYLDEIIVIDDASEDNSVAKIMEFDGKVTLIRNKKNLGKADAVFKGIKASSCELIFLMDADLEGVKTRHFDECISEFVNRELDMLLVPVGTSPSFFSSVATFLGSDIVVTGQRILRKSKILPHMKKGGLGYGLEMYLNKLGKTHDWKTDIILWKNSEEPPATPLKMKKFGIVKGLTKDFKMLSEVFKQAKLSDYLSDYTFMVRKPVK